MKKSALRFLLLATTLAAVLPLSAADTAEPTAKPADKPAKEQRLSPTETVEATLAGDKLKVVYSRPYTKHPKTGEVRKIWGGLVPYDKIWRTGANEATLFTTKLPILVGTTTIPAGTYSLFTLPKKDGSAKLIFNKQTGQPGNQYDEKQDFARVDLTKGEVDKPVHQFTILFATAQAGSGRMLLEWEDTSYALDFSVLKK